MDYLEPFLVFIPSETGMTESEVKETSSIASSLHQSIDDFLRNKSDGDDIDDRLRAIGLEPAEYWEDTLDNLSVIAEFNPRLDSLGLLYDLG